VTHLLPFASRLSAVTLIAGLSALSAVLLIGPGLATPRPSAVVSPAPIGPPGSTERVRVSSPDKAVTSESEPKRSVRVVYDGPIVRR
jgi:hypothetical protein